MAENVNIMGEKIELGPDSSSSVIGSITHALHINKGGPSDEEAYQIQADKIEQETEKKLSDIRAEIAKLERKANNVRDEAAKAQALRAEMGTSYQKCEWDMVMVFNLGKKDKRHVTRHVLFDNRASRVAKLIQEIKKEGCGMTEDALEPKFKWEQMNFYDYCCQQIMNIISHIHHRGLYTHYYEVEKDDVWGMLTLCSYYITHISL